MPIFSMAAEAASCVPASIITPTNYFRLYQLCRYGGGDGFAEADEANRARISNIEAGMRRRFLIRCGKGSHAAIMRRGRAAMARHRMLIEIYFGGQLARTKYKASAISTLMISSRGIAAIRG